MSKGSTSAPRRAILATFGLLLGAVLPGSAFAEDVRGASITPLVAYAWSGETRPHVIPMYWVIEPRDLPDPSRAKAATDRMPPGHRVLFLWSDVVRRIDQHPDDCCRDADGKLTEIRGVWWDAGVAETAARLDRWFAEFRKRDGRVDTVILDFEGNSSNWSLGENVARHRAIERDSRFAEIARKLAIQNLEPVTNWRSGPTYQKWNALMDHRQGSYVNRAVYEPIRRHYPDVRLSNYGYYYNKPPYVCPDRNGYEHAQFETGLHVGTHQSAPLYGWLGSARWSRIDGTALRRGGSGQEYGNTPFDAFRLSVNQMRSMKLSSDIPLMPWVSHKRFQESYFKNLDLHQELVLHAALTAPDALLYWNPRLQSQRQNADHFTTSEQDQLLSDCLREFNALVGSEPRTTLVERLAGWGDDFVLSGMTVGDHTVWRFTPAPDETGLSTLAIVTQSPAAVQSRTTTITFAEGKVHRPDRPVSTAGLWIMAPAGARPVQTANGTR